MRFSVSTFHSDQHDAWSRVLERSNEGTLFHDLGFLAYHGDRFKGNEHHLVVYKGTTVYSVMPMAIFEEDDQRVAKSPYGGSYGGPVFDKPQNYQDSYEIVEAILGYLQQKRIGEIRLTLPLSACYKRYSETFRLVMMECGFECVNRDISSLVYTGANGLISERMTSRARNMARKAQKTGVEVVRKTSVDDFWQVLDANFDVHGADPTHTSAEFKWLHQHFAERVYVDVAYLDGTPVAGIGYFVINGRMNSSFYLCQDPQYRQSQALSLLIYDALEQAHKDGYKWFDFGTSSVNMQGRSNIFRFKESFGAVGLFRETYVWRDRPG